MVVSYLVVTMGKTTYMYVCELLSAAISLIEMLTVLYSIVLSSYCSVLTVYPLRLRYQITNHALRTCSGERLCYLTL